MDKSFVCIDDCLSDDGIYVWWQYTNGSEVEII